MNVIPKILIVEHDQSDLELLQHELNKAGISYLSEIVQTEQDYDHALRNFIPDIILSDYSLPSFNGPTAFKIREQIAPDTPFIFVSGNIGEENSIELIKNGLTDYVLKDKLFTLNTKVKRALKESEEKQQKKLDDEKVEFNRNNLSSLINNTNDLMWSVDRDCKLITSNKPFDEMVKYMTGKTIAKGSNGLSAGFSPEQVDQYKKSYERAFAGEKFTEVQYIDNPEEVWSEISFCPICKGEEVIGTACHSRDITERKLAELERAKITDDLIRRNKDLEQFSYIISHNLRAPVANIIGLSNLAQNTNLEPGLNKEIMDGLSLSVMKLDGVIIDLNNILMVKSEINEKKKIVFFSQLVNDIQLSIKNLIKKENALILYDFSDADEMLTVKSYLHSIFYNLISNSLKYHRPGIHPVIEINSHKQKNKIELIFKDNGMGINLEKERDFIFGLYKRFHTDTGEGKGMGLYMVKTQVETLGGKISIISEVNQGTEFKIELPD